LGQLSFGRCIRGLDVDGRFGSWGRDSFGLWAVLLGEAAKHQLLVK
jgi:hypothetical protein